MKKLLLLCLLLAIPAHATVNTTALSASQGCNGTQTAFVFSFPYLSVNDLVVTSTLSGTPTTLALGTDYTVSPSFGSSGTVTLVAGSRCPNTATLKILRNVLLTQPTGLRGQGPYNPGIHETEWDRLLMQIQQVAASAVAGATITNPCTGDITTNCQQVTATHLAASLPVAQGGTGASVNTSSTAYVALQPSSPGTPQTGVLVVTGPANTAAAILKGSGNGAGVSGTGGSSSGKGGYFTGGGANGVGVAGVGVGNGVGIQTVGGTGTVGGNGGLFQGGGPSGGGISSLAYGAICCAAPALTGTESLGYGSGPGAYSVGGATGVGDIAVGGSTSGDGVQGSATSGNGGTFTGGGSGVGVKGTGGATGAGATLNGGATSGDGVDATATGIGAGGSFIGGLGGRGVYASGAQGSLNGFPPGTARPGGEGIYATGGAGINGGAGGNGGTFTGGSAGYGVQATGGAGSAGASIKAGSSAPSVVLSPDSSSAPTHGPLSFTNTTAFPSAPTSGEVFYHSTANVLCTYTGSRWVCPMGGVIALVSGSPSTASVTLPVTGMFCACSDATQVSAIKCGVSGTTLSIIGPNTVADNISYVCN